ncbi:hypothetical protein HDU76_004190 [Blyttiomyces sp. JEL0837]|nr:hypothetical protein HDU76_004190 [Blyttiomyces sp. JEL0837]
MKAKTLQIHWHDKLPIYSLDFQPSTITTTVTTTTAHNITSSSTTNQSSKLKPNGDIHSNKQSTVARSNESIITSLFESDSSSSATQAPAPQQQQENEQQQHHQPSSSTSLTSEATIQLPALSSENATSETSSAEPMKVEFTDLQQKTEMTQIDKDSKPSIDDPVIPSDAMNVDNVKDAVDTEPEKTETGATAETATTPSSPSSGQQEQQRQQHQRLSRRFATAGGDKNVRIWRLIEEEGQPPKVEFLSNLDRHTAVVNCVRWSPSGNMLASCGDGGCIFLWYHDESRVKESTLDQSDIANVENWRVYLMYKVPGADADLYDLAWSPDETCVLVGCTDHKARVWNIKENKCIFVIDGHTNFVQGVAWDPLDQIIATQSRDRHLHLFSRSSVSGTTSKFQLLGKVSKRSLKQSGGVSSTAQEESAEANGDMATDDSAMVTDEMPEPVKPPVKPKPTTSPLFYDETLPSFFRRLQFSPDGGLLIAPAGIFRESGDHAHVGEMKDMKNTVYAFARGRLMQDPIFHLPGHAKPTVAIRFNPLRFKHRIRPGPLSVSLRLPYRFYFAVASLESVVIYDSSQVVPFAVLSNLHYGSLTDIAWSSDGLTLLMSATDGFCSIVSFTLEELGEPCEPVAVAVTATPDFTTAQSESGAGYHVVEGKRVKLENVNAMAMDDGAGVSGKVTGVASIDEVLVKARDGGDDVVMGEVSTNVEPALAVAAEKENDPSLVVAASVTVLMGAAASGNANDAVKKDGDGVVKKRRIVPTLISGPGWPGSVNSLGPPQPPSQ